MRSILPHRIDWQPLRRVISAGKSIPASAPRSGTEGDTGAGGQSTFGYAFTAADFLKVASAIEDYVYQIYSVEAVLHNGGQADWPAGTVTIA